ncbi:SpoIIE family protein phosphatase [Actinospica sp. MGRD01-02]|uniref:SpoIIE family protein phosphatase n=1 Tax=Actinospica acidithermotolerans TaxID=2828514 RepID=A0A941IJ91_9ACTN|nr:SpoIIE family protein phosphatase [Actinospica acidithermotolerans]MBR7830475.1 SpoIIE family protein phosphatase [Actinospica acidithermotolerans]
MAGQVMGTSNTPGASAPGVAGSPAVPARRRAERTSEPGSARATLLSRAGRLLGTSLDTGRTLAAIAELVVPSFADQCVVDLLEDTGALRRAVSVRLDRERARRVSVPGPADRRVVYPNEHPCAVALRTGAPVLAEFDQPRATEPQQAGRASHSLMSDAAMVIAVPLLGPRGIKGVLAVGADGINRKFSASDVELVEEVAARAGFALENAALYESMRSLALALQHSLLPAHLPTIDGIEVQVGYNAGDESDVGGDLYDVIELAAGRVGIVIGDVQGRGAHAAAVMGQLRAALRAYAVLDEEPAQVLQHLDSLVQGLNEALLVTCVYAVFDPFTRECVLANAGHPPPLLAGAHGCHPMELPPDVPLGVGGVTFNDHTFTVAPGDTIFLYTDGVVEQRGRSVDEGVRDLCEALEEVLDGNGPGGTDATPAALCRAALRSSNISGPADDDRAVLAMRTAVGPLPLWRLSLPATPSSPSAARAAIRPVLEQWGMHAQADTVELLLSELVTNAVRHAAGPAPAPRYDPESVEDLDLESLELALLDNAPMSAPGEGPQPPDARQVEVVARRGTGTLWIEVYDQDVRMPRVRTAAATDEGGRGLFLVDQLSKRWGARDTRTGKAVWFQV